MKYNVLSGGIYTVNTDLGNRDLSYTELVDLITSNKAGSIAYEEVITYYDDYTWNPSDKAPGLTLSNSNLTVEQTSADSTQQKVRHIQGKTTGKYYFEIKVDSEANGMMIGVGASTSPLYENVGHTGVAYNYDGLLYGGSEQTSYGSSWTDGDIIGIAFDLSNGRIWFSKNGSWQAGGSPGTDTSPAYYLLAVDEENPIIYHPAVSTYHIGEKSTGHFSEEAFTYDIPTGFSAYSISQTTEYAEVWVPAAISGEPAVTLSSGSLLVIDVDLGVRVHLDSLAYVFESTTSGALPASGIKFSYKDESSYVYTDLATFTGNNGLFYTSVSGSLFAPRYLRLTHSLGTTSGLAYSFSAFNDDTVVGFGIEDELKVQPFATPRDNKANIKVIPIYNNSAIKASAEISLDRTYSELEDTISISISEGGPWSYPNLGEIEIGSSNGSYGFDWGRFNYLGENKTTVIDTYGVLQPEYYNDTSSEACYTLYSSNYISRVFYNDVVQTEIFINKKDDPEYTGKLSVDRDDTVDTIEVRSYNSPPTSYHTYTALIYTSNIYYGYYYYHFYIRRYDVRDGTYENLYNIDPNDLNADGTDKNTYSNTTIVSYEIVTSRSDIHKNAGWLMTMSTNAPADTRFTFFTYNGTTRYSYELQYHTTTNTNLDAEVFHFKRRADGGIWAYFFAVFMHDSDFIDKSGHYLVAFNEDLSNTFKGYNWSRSVGYMDVAEDSNYLWYTIPESNTIYKMNTSGIHELQYEYSNGYTDDLGPIAVLPEDGGVWFINRGTTLYKISATSPTVDELVLDIIELPTSSDVFLMSLDPDDCNYMWIAWGNNVGYLCMSGDRKGEILFSVSLSSVVNLLPVYSGCWIRTVSFASSSDDYIKFLSKDDQKIIYTKSIPYAGVPSPIERTYKDKEYVPSALFPEKPYNPWQGLEWQKINLNTFLISEEKYYQFRLTFWPLEADVNYPGEAEYIIEDTFTQASTRPREVLWSDWQDKTVGSGLNRVYVNTVSGTLVLTPGVSDPYILASKVLVSPEADGSFDIRYKYKYGNGSAIVNGVDSTHNYIYLRLYAVDSNRRSSWFYFGQDLLYNGTTWYADTDIDTQVSFTRNDYYAQAPDSWMRLYSYKYNNELHLGMSSYRNNAWYNYEYQAAITLMPGNAMYVEIFQDKSNSRNLNIEEFKIVSGNIYGYYANPTRVNGIYLKTPVKLNDIAPYSYKNIYVKHQVPVDFSGNASYETNLKARWEIPTY